MNKFIILTFLIWASFAKAENSDLYCDANLSRFCAYIEAKTAFKTDKASEYDVVLKTNQDSQVDDIKIEMVWESEDFIIRSIPGHIERTAVDRFSAQKALLMLPGSWMINITFHSNDQSYFIQIPVVASE